MAPGVLQSEAPASLPTQKVKQLDHREAYDPNNDIYGNYFPADPKTLSLESNFGPMDPASIGYLQPTHRDTPLNVMRERFERDGYLLVCPFTAIEIYMNTRKISDIGNNRSKIFSPTSRS